MKARAKATLGEPVKAGRRKRASVEPIRVEREWEYLPRTLRERVLACCETIARSARVEATLSGFAVSSAGRGRLREAAKTEARRRAHFAEMAEGFAALVELAEGADPKARAARKRGAK